MNLSPSPPLYLSYSQQSSKSSLESDPDLDRNQIQGVKGSLKMFIQSQTTKFPWWVHDMGKSKIRYSVCLPTHQVCNSFKMKANDSRFKLKIKRVVSSLHVTLAGAYVNAGQQPGRKRFLTEGLLQYNSSGQRAWTSSSRSKKKVKERDREPKALSSIFLRR